jgi:hypothetical protein
LASFFRLVMLATVWSSDDEERNFQHVNSSGYFFGRGEGKKRTTSASVVNGTAKRRKREQFFMQMPLPGFIISSDEQKTSDEGRGRLSVHYAGDYRRSAQTDVRRAEKTAGNYG